MRILLVVCCLLTLSLSVRSQPDTRLRERLDSIMKATGSSNFEQILELTYPKLFTIVTRDQMLEVLKSAFDTDEFIISIDSLRLDTIYPIVKIGEGSYARINHSQIMLMKLKEPVDTTDEEERESWAKMMEAEFGKGNAQFDKATNTLRIRMQSQMIAVKDSFAKDWCFINLEEDSDAGIIAMLFDKEVIEKLRQFK